VQSLTRVLDEEKRALEEEDRVTESTTTVRPGHTEWPQNAARLSVNMDDFLWDTTLYDWQTIEQALASQDEMK
ncbi:hypothetical protein Q604_UNBC03899G0001, partial [human gut metagenome]